ncbi:Histidine protein kinase AsgD [Labilithrix luteola]|uniref:histidine kinase n=1 Tax=Labilithrix luteola TaxID=1391654 RepID=A0A0K1PUB4_9BACT|nr:ATP-binding protein [Labilithrix luteola]AKU96961.1 Histidine protein kinase AsgD [Labilithrix luteola]
MLADVLVDIRPKVLDALERQCEPDALEALAEYVDQLTLAMRTRRFDPTSIRSESQLAMHADGFLANLAKVRTAVYDALEDSESSVSMRDARLLADWFAVAADHVRDEARKRREAFVTMLTTFAGPRPSDVEGIAKRIAGVAVPEIAEACVIDALEGGKFRRVEACGRDLARIDTLFEAPLPDASELASRQSAYVADVASDAETKTMLAPSALAASKIRSLVSVPIAVLGETLGVVTFLTARKSGRRFDAGDVAFLDSFVDRASRILARTLLEYRARQGAERFRVALANSSIVIFESDANGKLSWLYNSQLERFVGSMMGRRLNEFMTKEQSDALDEVERQVVESGARVTTEVVLEIKKGVQRHMLLNFEALKNAGSETIGLTGTAVDITEAKRNQEQLLQGLAFRDRMMGILGHDLRNPLSAVQGIVGLLLLDTNLQEQTKNGLVHVDKATRRMSEMIQSVLDFTRTRFHGSLPIEPKPMSLRDVCLTVLDELRVAHPGRELTLETVGDADGEWDPGRMAQVVSNLVGNALTHGERGTPVKLVLHGDEATVSLAVENRGNTIPKEKLERLFEPFEQGVDTDSSRRPQGLGLGLYIARQIVESHGGTLVAESEAQKVVFTLRLDRKRA